MANTRLPKFYSIIAIVFVILAIIGGAAVTYFILGKTEVLITSAAKKVSADMLIDVRDPQFNTSVEISDAVDGKIVVLETEDSKSYEATGSKEVSDDTIGRVTLINNYSKDQALVATTRLLSPDGVLIRLKEAVKVPAGGSVEAQVYPDKPELFNELAPTKFTIPGLWEGLREKIYAENKSTLKKGGQKVPVVTADDLAAAEKDMVEILTKKAIDSINSQLDSSQSLYSKLIQKEIIEKNFDAKAGDEKSQLGLSMKIKAVVIAFDEAKLLNIVKQRLSQTLSSDMKLNDVDTNSLNYTVEKYDSESRVANIKVYAEGKAALKDENTILNKSALAGKSESEIIEYFTAFPEVEKVEIKFNPTWIKKASLVPSRINFVIQ